MPHLDAKALKVDRKGMAFLRDVLKRNGTTEPGDRSPGRNEAERRTEQREPTGAAPNSDHVPR